jgi:hypothetical protein
VFLLHFMASQTAQWDSLNANLAALIYFAETHVPLIYADVAHLRNNVQPFLHVVKNRQRMLPIALHATMVFLGHQRPKPCS